MEKKFLLIVLITLAIVAFAVFVFAANPLNMAGLTSPTYGGNYSGTMNFTCIATGYANVTNATLYYNSTGGGRISTDIAPNLTTIKNTSAAQTIFTSASIDILTLTTYGPYNFSCLVTNFSGPPATLVYSSELANITLISAYNVTIDNRAPNITQFTLLVKTDGTTTIGSTGNSSSITVPSTGANLTGSITLNVSVNESQVDSVVWVQGMDSVYFNISRINLTQNLESKALIRASRNITGAPPAAASYYNYSNLSTTGYVSGRYIVNIYANDSGNNINRSSMDIGGYYVNLTVDNNAPNITKIEVNSSDNARGMGTGANVSGKIIINVTINDTLVEDGTWIQGLDANSIYFNITTDAGKTQKGFNITTVNRSVGATEVGLNLTYANLTINTEIWADGKYQIYVWANDSGSNLNRTEYINITIDNHGPDITATKNDASSTSDKLVIDVVIDDGQGVGIFSTCTTDRTGDTVTDTDTTQTITETGLTPSSDYAYEIKCADFLGQNGTLTKTFSTSAAAAAEAAGGGGMTYVPSSEQVESTEGYRRDVEEFDIVKVTIEKKEYDVQVGGVTAETATVSVAGEEQTLNVGEEKKFDVTGDGYYDLYVKLNSITNNKADVTIRAIHELVPEEEEKKEAAPIVEAAKGLAKSVWFWVIVIVVILAIVGYIVYYKKKSSY